MNIAETERIILRRFTLHDAADMAAILGDPEVMKYSLSGPLSFDQTQRFIEDAVAVYARKGFGLWAVESKAAGRVIGYCGHYFQMIDGREEVELSYRLARPFWGKGLATEAARSALRHAFCALKLPRLISIIAAENIASIKVAAKCGLTYHKDAEFHGIPVGIYAISAPDYFPDPKQEGRKTTAAGR